MIRSKPGSCFLDACDLGLGLPADVVGAFIDHNFPHFNCDQDGYPPTLVNIAALELYKIGISQLDAQPVALKDGAAVSLDEPGKVMEILSGWFSRPGFRCVITGPAIYGRKEEHANAWNGSHWIDPANPTTLLDAPSINIRSVWVVTLPPPRPVEVEAADDSTE